MSIGLIMCKLLHLFWSASGPVNGQLYHLALQNNPEIITLNMIHLKRLFLIDDYGSVLHLLTAVGTSPSFYSLCFSYYNINRSAKNPNHILRQKKSIGKHLKRSNLILVMCARQTGIYMYLCRVCNLFLMQLLKWHHILLPLTVFINTERNICLLSSSLKMIINLTAWLL